MDFPNVNTKLICFVNVMFWLQSDRNIIKIPWIDIVYIMNLEKIIGIYDYFGPQF